MRVTSCQRHTLPLALLNIQRLFSSYQKVQIWERAYSLFIATQFLSRREKRLNHVQIASTQGTWYNAHREIETRQFRMEVRRMTRYEFSLRQEVLLEKGASILADLLDRKSVV